MAMSSFKRWMVLSLDYMRTIELGQEPNVNVDIFRKSENRFILFMLVFSLCDIVSYVTLQ